jgi:hypothetical protein
LTQKAIRSGYTRITFFTGEWATSSSGSATPAGSSNSTVRGTTCFRIGHVGSSGSMSEA